MVEICAATAAVQGDSVSDLNQRNFRIAVGIYNAQGVILWVCLFTPAAGVSMSDSAHLCDESAEATAVNIPTLPWSGVIMLF